MLNYGNQALPFDPQYPRGQMIQVQPGQAPFVPNISCPPQIQQYLPLIVSLAIMHIQQTAQQNPLRTFMFNQYSVNGYMNPEFTELVEVIANYVHLRLMSGQDGGDPIAAIQRWSQILVQAMAGSVIKFFPAIQSYLTPDQVAAATNGVRSMETVVHDLQRALNPQQHNTGYPAQNQGGYMNQGMGPGGGQVFQGQGYQNRPVGLPPGSTGLFGGGNQQPQNHQVYRQNDQQYNTSSNRSANADRYARQLASQNAQPVRGVDTSYVQNNNQQDPAIVSQVRRPGMVSYNPETDKTTSPAGQAMRSMETPAFSRHLQPLPTVPEQQAPVQNEPQGTEQTHALYTSDQVSWRRSDRQPYHPAWNSRKQKVLYAKIEGDVIAVIVDRTPQEMAQMEYDKHAFGIVPTSPSMIKNPETQEPRVIHREIPNAEIHLTVKDSMSMDVCEAEAAIYSNLEARVGGHLKGTAAAYTSRRCVTTPLYCENEEVAERYRDVIDQLSKCPTFKEARRILSELTSPEELHLFNVVNKLLTDEVNTALAVNLSLPGFSIESFTEDTEELDRVLRREVGDNVATALKDQESFILSGAISSMGKNEAQEYAAGLVADLPGASEWTGALVFIPYLVSFTNVNLLSHQLNLAGVSGNASVLSENATPEFFSVASQLLGDRAIRNEKYRRHYLVTADGERFEITKGFMNKESILIRRA